MKRQKLYCSILLFLLIVIGFNSCTIKKRLYQPGYHVERQKLSKKTQSHSDNITSVDLIDIKDNINVISDNHKKKVTDSRQEENYQELDQLYATNNTNEIEIQYSNNSNSTFSIKPSKSGTKILKNGNKGNSSKPKTLIDGGNKFHRGAITGFALSVFSVLLTLISYIGAFYSIAILGQLAIIFAIAGIILSIISLRTILKNPEEYKGKVLAIIGIIANPITYYLIMISIFLIVRMYID